MTTTEATIEITSIDQTWRAERLMNNSDLTWVEALNEIIKGDALMAALQAEPVPTFDNEADQIRRSEARWNR